MRAHSLSVVRLIYLALAVLMCGGAFWVDPQANTELWIGVYMVLFIISFPLGLLTPLILSSLKLGDHSLIAATALVLCGFIQWFWLLPLVVVPAARRFRWAAIYSAVTLAAVTLYWGGARLTTSQVADLASESAWVAMIFSLPASLPLMILKLAAPVANKFWPSVGLIVGSFGAGLVQWVWIELRVRMPGKRDQSDNHNRSEVSHGSADH